MSSDLSFVLPGILFGFLEVLNSLAVIVGDKSFVRSFFSPGQLGHFLTSSLFSVCVFLENFSSRSLALSWSASTAGLSLDGSGRGDGFSAERRVGCVLGRLFNRAKGGGT